MKRIIASLVATGYLSASTVIAAPELGAGVAARPIQLKVDYVRWQGYVNGNWATVACPPRKKLVGCSAHCGGWQAGGDMMDEEGCKGGCATANSIIVVAACADVR